MPQALASFSTSLWFTLASSISRVSEKTHCLPHIHGGLARAHVVHRSCTFLPFTETSGKHTHLFSFLTNSSHCNWLLAPIPDLSPRSVPSTASCVVCSSPLPTRAQQPGLPIYDCAAFDSPHYKCVLMPFSCMWVSSAAAQRTQENVTARPSYRAWDSPRLRPHVVLRKGSHFLAPCSLLALLPTLSNTLSSGSHLLVSARLLPAMRLAALLQTRAWTSRQLPPALTGLDLTSAPAGPHGSETEVLLRCPHNTLHSISPLKWRISLVISLWALTATAWTRAHGSSAVSGLLPAVFSCHLHCSSPAPASFLLLPHHAWLFLPTSWPSISRFLNQLQTAFSNSETRTADNFTC